MYRTGDRARWIDGGQLEFLGRADNQVKINGFRVETGDVESILGRCPFVQQTFVQPLRDTHGEIYLVAWVVPAELEPPSQEELRGHLAAHLPHYMVPRQFVMVSELPVNAAGKVDARALPEPPAVRPQTCEFVPPRNRKEQLLADIWCDTLSISSIGVHDSFFELGGGSLTSLRIASRATDAGLAFNSQPVEPELLFRYPTIGQLAAQLDQQDGE